jgi:hypothetical protein
MSLFNTTLVFLLALCTLVVVTDGTTVCTYRRCSCANKACTSFTGCTTFTQDDGECGALNRVCDCADMTISAYSSTGCAGSPTNAYNSGSFYNKTFCYYIDSCTMSATGFA